MKIKYSRKGLAKLPLMPGLIPEISKHVDSIAAASGDGFYPHTNPGRRRHRGAVVAGGPQAARRNRKENTLIRNLNAGR